MVTHQPSFTSRCALRDAFPSIRLSKLGYSPVVRDIRRFAKLGFHALFHNLNYRHGVVKIGLARRVMLCTIYRYPVSNWLYGIE